MQAVILAAGKGSRLHPLTAKRSKAMIPVLGKPITERVLEILEPNGINDYVIVASPDDHELASFFLHRSRFRSSVQLVPQPHPLGMANALHCASAWIQGDFLLSSCDNLVSAEDISRMVACWREEPRPTAVLALMEVSRDQLISTGVVELQDQWVMKIVEKPGAQSAPSNIACLPLYCLSHNILDYLPEVPLSLRGEYEIQEAIQMLIDRLGGVRGIMLDVRQTLTNSTDLRLINLQYLSSGNYRTYQEPRRIGPDTILVEPFYIERGVVLGANCRIGPNVYIEHGCHIGDNVVIRDSVLLQEAVIQAGAKIAEQVIS